MQAAEKHLKSEKARKLALERARTFTRPLLIGHVALECQMSLQEAETLLDSMVDDGILRRATPRELRDADLQSGYRPADSPV
jgi:hypothetical protein